MLPPAQSSNLTPSSGEWVEGETSELDRSMKPRHLNMIAIGGSIGAGFFVGSGSALTKGGPASVLICFSIAGIMIFNVVYALGELAVMYPVSGGFYTYSVRFVDPSWGFAMGWNYVSNSQSHSSYRSLTCPRSFNGSSSYLSN